jgi:PadR family transcriptional regulator, regulatory protein PadR
MPDKPSDLVQGTFDRLILKTLALPLHGYPLAVRIEQISKGAFRVTAGSLFVAFGAAATGGSDQGGMESHREQQARQVLLFNRTGAQAAQWRNPRMEQADSRDRQDFGGPLTHT